MTGFGVELRRQSRTLRRRTKESFMLPSKMSTVLEIERAFQVVLFNICWTTEIIPTHWLNAITVILFKKVDRSLCGNYRGISLLSAVGEVFAGINLQSLNLLAEYIYPQPQSGYRNVRRSIDGIFTLRQLKEKQESSTDVCT